VAYTSSHLFSHNSKPARHNYSVKNDNIETRNAHKILVGKYESKGPLEEHKHRQNDEMIKCVYLKEI
jgi:hypothetical protein